MVWQWAPCCGHPDLCFGLLQAPAANSQWSGKAAGQDVAAHACGEQPGRKAGGGGQGQKTEVRDRESEPEENNGMEKMETVSPT